MFMRRLLLKGSQPWVAGDMPRAWANKTDVKVIA